METVWRCIDLCHISKTISSNQNFSSDGQPFHDAHDLMTTSFCFFIWFEMCAYFYHNDMLPTVWSDFIKNGKYRVLCYSTSVWYIGSAVVQCLRFSEIPLIYQTGSRLLGNANDGGKSHECGKILGINRNRNRDMKLIFVLTQFKLSSDLLWINFHATEKCLFCLSLIRFILCC